MVSAARAAAARPCINAKSGGAQRAAIFLSGISPTDVRPHPLCEVANAAVFSEAFAYDDSLSISKDTVSPFDSNGGGTSKSVMPILQPGSSANSGKSNGTTKVQVKMESKKEVAPLSPGAAHKLLRTKSSTHTGPAAATASSMQGSMTEVATPPTPQQVQRHSRQLFAADLLLRKRRQETFLKSLTTTMKSGKRHKRHSNKSSRSSSSASAHTKSSSYPSRNSASFSPISTQVDPAVATKTSGAVATGEPDHDGQGGGSSGVAAGGVGAGPAGSGGGLGTDPARAQQHQTLSSQPTHHRRFSVGRKPPLHVGQVVKKEGQRVRLRWVYGDVPQQSRRGGSSRTPSPSSSSTSSSSKKSSLHCYNSFSNKAHLTKSEGATSTRICTATNNIATGSQKVAGVVGAETEMSGTPHSLSSTNQTHTRSSSSSSSSSSSGSSSPGRSAIHRRRREREQRRLWWARLASAPMSLCTILTKFEPRVAALGKEDQVIQPYRGESKASSSSSSSKGRSSSSSSTSSASSSSSSSASSASVAHYDADGEYQDFVVNSRYLAGNYADRSHVAEMASVDDSSSSSDSGDSRRSSSLLLSSSKTDSSSDPHSSRLHSRSSSSSRDSRSSSRYSRGSSSSDSRSSSDSSRSSANTRRRHHHHHGRSKGGGIISGEDNMRSYRKILARKQSRNNPAFSNAYFLDTGNITGGERRRKMISLPSYRVSMISFVDKKILKKDLNHNFYVQHPELEVREIKLTHLRKIKNELLVYALEDNSLLDLTTVAYAYWYFERLVVQGMVGKHNRKEIMASCVLLAIKFLETGDVTKKIAYFKNRWRRFHIVSGVHVGNAMLGGGASKEAEEDDEEVVQVDWKKVERQEFPVYVGLDFTLLPDGDGQVIKTHLERLLQLINVTSQEYYSKKFVAPAYLNNYNYYSNLYY